VVGVFTGKDESIVNDPVGVGNGAPVFFALAKWLPVAIAVATNVVAPRKSRRLSGIGIRACNHTCMVSKLVGQQFDGG